ncbi:MAG: hypothetical protein LJE65_13640 [Desulfobacteraceae bacterium]|jgi:hypothetical protein|nr:hypothetical protein [Desulfobacteraceae bacterium]
MDSGSVSERAITMIRKTCNATGYCRINRTPTVPTGSGRERKCPVCGTEYKQDPPGKQNPKHRTPEEVQEFIDGMGGTTVWP